MKAAADRSGLIYPTLSVDNGSADGTSRWLRAFRRRALGGGRTPFLREVRVIRNERNLGYPLAMNQGIRAARGDHLVFGNSDAAVAPFWLEGMQDALRARRGIGGISPCTNQPQAPHSPAPWAARPSYRGIKGLERFAAASYLRAGVPPHSAAAGFIPGFWFLTRRAVIEDVGPFDEAFSPGGCEDWDLQWRILSAGYSLGFAERVYVHHIGFGCSERNGLTRENIYRANRKRLYKKHPGAARLPFSIRVLGRLPVSRRR